jgi:hypothetical protein
VLFAVKRCVCLESGGFGGDCHFEANADLLDVLSKQAGTLMNPNVSKKFVGCEVSIFGPPIVAIRYRKLP